MRNPLERRHGPVPQHGAPSIDWVFTIVGAIPIVLAIKAWVVNPYRIPSSSMEPTLHCARNDRPGEVLLDRVLANRFIYHFTEPKRGDIVVFDAPARARALRRGRRLREADRRLPGDTWEEKRGFVYINGKRLTEPYRAERRDFMSHAEREDRARTATS